MSILLARIDDRLVHGQVTEGWGKRIRPDRIVVVSDSMACSEWECDLCLASLPSSIKGRVVAVKDAPEVINSLRGEKEGSYVLFESPCDALQVVESGARLEEINVGGMHSTRGKRRILDYVYVNEKDAACLTALRNAGVRLDFRDLPDRESADVMGQI